MSPLLLAAALAGADARIAALDLQLAANDRARRAAEAPLDRLLGQAERLALAPRSPARDDALVRAAALIRLVAPSVRHAGEPLARERHRLAGERARLVLAGLRRRVGGPAIEGAPSPLPSCDAAAWRPPIDAFAVPPALAARLSQARGLMLVTLPAAPFTAPADARVAYAGRFRRYGGTLILDHGHGWTTLVTGLDRLDARTDARVVAGEPLGWTAAEAPLLGIELSRHGRAVDPWALLRRCGG